MRSGEPTLGVKLVIEITPPAMRFNEIDNSLFRLGKAHTFSANRNYQPTDGDNDEKCTQRNLWSGDYSVLILYGIGWVGGVEIVRPTSAYVQGTFSSWTHGPILRTSAFRCLQVR